MVESMCWADTESLYWYNHYEYNIGFNNLTKQKLHCSSSCKPIIDFNGYESRAGE